MANNYLNMLSQLLQQQRQPQGGQAPAMAPYPGMQMPGQQGAISPRMQQSGTSPGMPSMQMPRQDYYQQRVRDMQQGQMQPGYMPQQGMMSPWSEGYGMPQEYRQELGQTQQGYESPQVMQQILELLGGEQQLTETMNADRMEREAVEEDEEEMAPIHNLMLLMKLLG